MMPLVSLSVPDILSLHILMQVYVGLSFSLHPHSMVRYPTFCHQYLGYIHILLSQPSQSFSFSLVTHFLSFSHLPYLLLCLFSDPHHPGLMLCSLQLSPLLLFLCLHPKCLCMSFPGHTPLVFLFFPFHLSFSLTSLLHLGQFQVQYVLPVFLCITLQSQSGSFLYCRVMHGLAASLSLSLLSSTLDNFRSNIFC